MKEGFADTSSRYYLEKRAMERGLKPVDATYSIVLAKLDGDINLEDGERFSTDEGIIFFYIGEKQEEYYKLKCEEKGIKGNISYGELLPIDNIPKLQKANIHKILTLGCEEEDTENFRKRYFDSFKTQAFGGNRADYIEKIRLLNSKETILDNGGIGGIKIYRTPDGGGTVDIMITNNSYNLPTQELINLAQEEIDPVQYSGDGKGIAPIGHFVTIKSVNTKVINIETVIELREGYSLEDIKEYIEQAIEKYLSSLRESWEENDTTIIRISYIESVILDVLGVEDIRETTINGLNENFVLDGYTIPLRGDINVA